MATNISKSLKLIPIIYKFWLMRMMEFRGEVITWSAAGILWGIVSFVLVNVIFTQVNTIAGWTKEEVLILTAVHQLFIHFLWFFILPGILNFASSIREGKLDVYLLRPIGGRFLLSFSEFQFTNYFPFLTMAAFLMLFIAQSKILLSAFSIAGFMILMGMGLFLFYCLFFAIATTSFWFINIFNLESLFDSILGIGRFPTQIFNKGVLFAFSYIIPTAYIATFPVQFLFGKGSAEQIIVGAALCVLFFAVSQCFWNFALKRYSSASS